MKYLLLLLPCSAFAASVVTEGPTTLVNGSSNVKTYPAPGRAQCEADIAALAAGQKRYCKTEYTTKAAPPVVTPPATPAWVAAVVEGKTFTLYKPATVRFGTGTKWVQKSLPAGTVYCEIWMFESDPAPGLGKVCEVSDASALVASVGTGTASLSWIAPTQNTDSTPLTDLTGYRVYHGAEVIPVTGTSYKFTGLSSGKHDFAVTAVNAAGVESDKATGSKVIP